MPSPDLTPRYWLKTTATPWQEVTEADFISAERQAGFRPKDGGSGVATASFNSSKSDISGRTTYGPITREAWEWDPEFLQVALPVEAA